MKKTTKIIYPTGALKNPIDNRDVTIAMVQAPMVIPSKHITDISMLPVLDQKQIGACVGHAVASMMAYQNFKETGKYIYLSPRYIYAMAKKIDGLAQQGTFPRVAGSVSTNKGCCTETLVKNDTTLSHEDYIKVTETKAVIDSAKIYKTSGYVSVPVDDTSLKQAIYANGVITITIGCGEITMKEIKPGTTNGQHYILLYGYEDMGTYTKFYYLNSWNDTWGDKGKSTFSSKDFKGLMYDAMVFTDIPNSVIEEAKAKYKYFSEKEVVGLNPDLVKMLDKAREIAGVPFKITSGKRTKDQNTNAGGVEDSAHLSGLAVDIASTTSEARFKILNALVTVGFTRLGIGETFIHADIDKKKAQNVIWHYYK